MTLPNQYTNQVSKTYDEENRRIESADPSRKHIRRTLDTFSRDKVILDVGCGGGIDLEAYWRMGFTKLIGIEPSPDQRNIATALLDSRATILDGCFERIPLADSSVDIVVSRFSLMYCLDIEKAFAESSRVLKHGGLFIAIVSHPDRDAKLPRNPDNTVTVHFYNGKMESTNPYHAIEEYIGKGFNRFFAPFPPIPYSDADMMGYSNKELLDLRPDEPTTLFFGGKKLTRARSNCELISS